jgi:hypothetical protein
MECQIDRFAGFVAVVVWDGVSRKLFIVFLLHCFRMHAVASAYSVQLQFLFQGAPKYKASIGGPPVGYVRLRERCSLDAINGK